MRRLRILGLGALLAVASSASWAFQEQQSGAPSSAANSVAPQQVGPASELAGSQPVGAPSKSSGTEIRIPGLGSLGVLPKMDFGLELLYGAAEQKSSDDSRNVGNGADDLAIQGTIRRKF